jgi:RNA polymerase sigma-70 factor (ECF subfamily)
LRFSTWAYRIATNLCINELKKKKHELEVFLEDINRKGETLSQSQNSKTNTIPSYPSYPSAEERLIQKDTEEKIGALVNLLPEKLKTVFILSEYQELTYREIAEVLEISLGVVHTRLHDSYKYLYDLIEKKGLVNEL